MGATEDFKNFTAEEAHGAQYSSLKKKYYQLGLCNPKIITIKPNWIINMLIQINSQKEFPHWKIHHHCQFDMII